MDNDEILDLFDQADTKIGTIARGKFMDEFDSPSGNIRYVDCFIARSDGKIWVPIRSIRKRIAPGGYDFSVAEHVLSGESYEEAIIRGVKEEAGITIEANKLKEIMKAEPSPGQPFFRMLYVLRTDEMPKMNTTEFTSADWLMPSELILNIQKGHPAKSVLEESILALMDMPDYI